MKKKILYSLAVMVSLLLTACKGDYKDWATPVSYSQEDAITLPGFTATSVETIDLNNEGIEENQKIFNIDLSALPSGYSVKTYDITIYPEMDTDGETVYSENVQIEDPYYSISDLQTLVKTYFGLRPVERTFKLAVVAIVQTNESSVRVDCGTPTLKVIPEAPEISENYYVVGGTLDWAGSAASKEQKFSHSSADVYDDPVFSIVINANTDGDTWFAIGSEEACDAITNDGDWTKLLGTTKGNGNTDQTGSLDYRYNLSDDGSFCVPAGSKLIKIEINMLDMTYTITPVNISQNYYLVGGPISDWAGSAASKEQKFSHSDKDVVEDPVFTYTFEGTGSEMWFAFGDDDALDAITNDNDWSKLFGTKGESKDLSGSFDYRYNLDGDHSFCVDGTAKYYQITVNMSTFEYEIKALNFAQFVYFIGATDGWTASDQKLESPSFDGVYTGYVYIADPNGWGLEFKFQKVAGSWDDQINSGTLTGGITGDFADGGDNIKATAGEGVYFVTLDLTSNTLNGVKIDNMNLVGDFNGWNAADDTQQMTWDAENYCYVITGATVTANGWKFTANNSWDVNLGGDTVDELVANGANLAATGSTIKLYPTRKTNDKIYCTVE